VQFPSVLVQPYTEPSLEIFQYHAELDKTIEIGNSGMFRPEMLEPMGIPSNVRVLGWGLSLERPTMVKYVPFYIFPFCFIAASSFVFRARESLG
jgi:hypothetical protein